MFYLTAGDQLCHFAHISCVFYRLHVICICEYFLFICCHSILGKSDVFRGIVIVCTDWWKQNKITFFFAFYVTSFCFESASLWGKSSTWQFLLTFLIDFSLLQHKLIHKLIRFLRNCVKDLAPFQSTFFRCSSIPSVEMISAIWCDLPLVLWCDALPFSIKHLQRDDFYA